MATANKDEFWKVDVEKLSLEESHKKRLAMKMPWPLLEPMLTLQTKRCLSIPSFLTRALMSSDKWRHSARQISGSYAWSDSFSFNNWSITVLMVRSWNTTFVPLEFVPRPETSHCSLFIIECSALWPSFPAIACPLRRLRSNNPWCSWLNLVRP